MLWRGDWADGQGDGAHGWQLDREVDEHLRVVPPHLDLEGLDRLPCAVWLPSESVYALPCLPLASDDKVTPPDCARDGDAVSQGAGEAEGRVLELVWLELEEHVVPQLGGQSQCCHSRGQCLTVEVNLSASRLTFLALSHHEPPRELAETIGMASENASQDVHRFAREGAHTLSCALAAPLDRRQLE